MKVDVIIIGSGLFGSMTSKYLQSKGIDTLVIDSNKVYAASKCSFGVWKDGWIGEHIKTQVKESLPVLQQFVDINEIDYYNADKDVVDKMFKIDCSLILNEQQKDHYLDMEVDKIGPDYVILTNGVTIKANKAVIVAAGAYTDDLLFKSGYPMINIDKQWGAILEAKSILTKDTIYSTWAPYKQSILLKTSDKSFLFGDGATVKNPVANDKRLDFVESRLIEHAVSAYNIGTGGDSTDLVFNSITEIKRGYRPYLPKGRHDFVQKHDTKLYTATGGAKSSTILSGYIAKTIFNLIK